MHFMAAGLPLTTRTNLQGHMSYEEPRGIYPRVMNEQMDIRRIQLGGFRPAHSMV